MRRAFAGRRFFSADTAPAATSSTTRWWDPLPADEPINPALFKREQKLAEMFKTYDSKFTLPPEPPTSKHIFEPSHELLPATMDEFILPHLSDTNKTEAELANLRSFLGRPCLINHKFWDADVWAKKEVDHYFRVKKARTEWNSKVKERHKYAAKERVREKEWVFADSRNVFSVKRRMELFGERDVDFVSAIIFGNVTRKRFGYLEIAWRVPDPKLARKLGLDVELGKTRPWWDFLPYQTIKVLHHNDDHLETLWPEEYVHKSSEDEFKMPVNRLHREDWVRELVIENRMVIFTESMQCPEYKRLVSTLGNNPNIYTVALDRGKLVGLTDEETVKVRQAITNVTNYPFFPQFFMMRMFVGGMKEFDQDVYRKDDIPGFHLFLRLTGVSTPDYHLRPYTRYLHQLFTMFNRKWFLHDKRLGYDKKVSASLDKEDPYSFMKDCYRLEREEFCEQAERVIPFLEQRMQEMSDEIGGEEIPEGVPLNVLIKMIYHPFFEDLQLKLKENRRKLQKLKLRDHKISVTGMESNLEALEEHELRDIGELKDEDGSLERKKVQEQILDADLPDDDENLRDDDDDGQVVFRHFKPKHANKEVFRDEDLFNEVEANERYMVEWIEEEEKFQTDEEYAMHLRNEMNAIMRSWTKEKRRDFFTTFYKQIQGKARYASKLYTVPKSEDEKMNLEKDRLQREIQFELSTLMRRIVREERKCEDRGFPLKRRPSKAQMYLVAEAAARKKLGFVREDNKNVDIDNATADWEALYLAELTSSND